MIITRTPYRISLFGGGTDYPEWYLNNEGSVVSFAIDKHSYISLRELPPFFDHRYRVAYSKVEVTNKIDEIVHPAVRAGFTKYASDLNLELHHHGDLPARSGIGSSSAFAVGLIKALSALNNSDLSSIELANMAIEFEQNDLSEIVGSQDQIACTFGGLNLIKFGIGNKWAVNKIAISDNYKTEIENRIILLYSGINRLSSDVSRTLVENLDSKSNLLQATHGLAMEAYEIITNEKDLSLIGPMLIESWKVKKEINSASVTPHLEDFFAKGLKMGASGGKILGAGGGGFFLFWIDPELRERFIEKMNPALVVPIKIAELGSTRIT